MARRSSSPSSLLFGLLSFLLLHPITTSIRLHIIQNPVTATLLPSFREAPAFSNGHTCKNNVNGANTIHIVMPLDTNYIRGTMAAVLSILQHSTCPENVSFHFLTVHMEPEFLSLIQTTFPYLNFTMHKFDSSRVHGKISKSIRQALDQPLNYARIYMPEILPPEVKRVIYLDSDIIVVDDIAKLWSVNLGGKVLAAPEYCHANFTNYFTEGFWSDTSLAGTFNGRKPCYFNTGVMVIDVEQWRSGASGITRLRRKHQSGAPPVEPTRIGR